MRKIKAVKREQGEIGVFVREIEGGGKMERERERGGGGET